MEALRETTVWTGVDYQQPNHDYLLDGDRIVAYRERANGYRSPRYQGCRL